MKVNLTIGTAALTAVLVCAALESPRGAALDLAVAGRINANPSAVASGRFVALSWAPRQKRGPPTSMCR